VAARLSIGFFTAYGTATISNAAGETAIPESE
jgi:hypothetical protein